MKLALTLLLCSCAAAPAAVEEPLALASPQPSVVVPTATPPAPVTVSSSPPPPAPTASATAPKPVTVGSATASVGAPSGSDPDERPIEFEVAGDMSAAQKNVLTVVGRCFVNALERGEASKGPLWVEVTIDDAGKATGVKVADGFSPKMKECVPPRVSKLGFPPPAKDGSIRSASRVLRFPINELSAETSDD